MMKSGDVYNRINEVDGTILDKIIKRLEFRDSDALFTYWRDTYLDKLPIGKATHILDVGCGTGVVTRAIAKRSDLSGQVIGSDFSPALIDAAKKRARKTGLDGQIDFQVGDIHALEYESDFFDIVIAHTVISHVSSPEIAIRELGRVVKPGGTLAIFDGDYGSLTFAYPDDEFARRVEEAFIDLVASNPRVMRKLPLYLADHGLEARDVSSYTLPEVGKSNFWMSAIETYTPMIGQSGQLPEDKLTDWLVWQRQASESGYFFGSCNYYTYLIERLDA